MPKRGWHPPLAAPPYPLQGAGAIPPSNLRQSSDSHYTTDEPMRYIHSSYPKKRGICKHPSLLHILDFTVFFPLYLSSHFLFFSFPLVLSHSPCSAALASPPAAGSRCLPPSHTPPLPCPREARGGGLGDAKEDQTQPSSCSPCPCSIRRARGLLGKPASTTPLAQKQKYCRSSHPSHTAPSGKATLARRSRSSSQPLSLFPII